MRYVSPDEDSGRWDGFPFREGDIVISTRSKSGTTWMQMICALLVFRTAELPAKLSVLSALVCGLLGLVTAYWLGCSAGATIALLLSVYFAVSFALRGRAG